MTTVILRAAAADPEDIITPAVPALLRVQNLMNWQRGDVLFVDRDLFEQAEAEMTERMKQRGYDYIARARMRQRNFLLFGVPVVCADG